MKFIFKFILLLFSVIGFTQNLPAEIKIKAAIQKDEILLRWAVTSPIEWQRANKTGYILTKYVVKRGKTILKTPEKIELAKTPILPAKLEKWKDIIGRDNYAAVIAQALFGETFKMTDTKESNISKIVNTAEELDQRHSFGLFAAEQSFEGAKLAGWAYEDLDVKPDELYVYQITVANNKKIKPTSIAVSLNEYQPLPKIKDFTAFGDDKKMLLIWDYKTHQNTYSSYKIERSIDGVNFNYITNTPITQLSVSQKEQKRMYYADTIQNNKLYQYRIHGITSFGENGPVSNAISAEGVADVFYTPRLNNYKINNTDITVEWEFPKEFENQIIGFEVSQAPKDGGPYQIVSKIIAKDQRKFEHVSDLPSNYYKVAVIGKNKKSLLSPSMLVQPIDSLPPQIPQILEKSIDSLGVVKIKFLKNTEKDFLGYRIYKANNPEEEFIDVLNKPYTKTLFSEKVSLKLMTDKVYYKFIAEDQRHNLSSFSEIIELIKPDKIPPSAPIFTDYFVENGTIKLLWINSSTEDVVANILERKQTNTNTWEEVFRVTQNETTFIDTKLEHNAQYQYRIKAIDDVGLVSDLSNSLITINFRDNTPQKAINNLTATPNREAKNIVLNWQINPKIKNIDNIQVYKNKEGEKPTLFKESSRVFNNITDINVYPSNNYQYHIMITTKNNQVLKTETITITY